MERSKWVAVQCQNLHHEDQGQAGKKKKKKKVGVGINLLSLQKEACLPLGIFAGGVSFCCGETDVPKHIQMCTNTHDAFLIPLKTCSWFIPD